MIFLLCGASGSGKTRLLMKITAELRRKALRMAGVLSPLVVKDGIRIGYDIINLSTGDRAKFARIWEEGVETEGRFNFLPEGLDLASRALENACQGEWDIVVVDEVGPLELRDRGFSLWVRNLVTLAPKRLILVVRPSLVKSVIQKYAIIHPIIIDMENQGLLEQHLAVSGL